MREQVLLALVQPYRKVTLSFIAKEVKLSIDEVVRERHTKTLSVMGDE